MQRPVLTTKRLVLRQFEQQDLPAFYQIFSDPEVNTYLPWFPLKSMDEAAQFFAQRYAKSNDYNYAICLKEDNLPIGYGNVSMQASHDLGYGLRKEFWRKGIVKEACQAILAQVKQDKIPYVTATHDVKNQHSGYVMQALGMKYQYSYEELWQPKNIAVTFRMYQLNFTTADDFVYREYWEKYPKHFVEEIVSE